MQDKPVRFRSNGRVPESWRVPPYRFFEHADVYIINTCTVTHKSDFQSRQLIRRAKRQNPDAKVIVAGCYAQVSPEEVAKIEGVDYVIGNTGKFDIAGILGSEVRGQAKITTTNILREREVKGFKVSTFSGHTRAFLKIQEGCQAFCSYCIVPYARGGAGASNLLRSWTA